MAHPEYLIEGVSQGQVREGVEKHGADDKSDSILHGGSPFCKR
jgi:hypothetical protein